MACSEPATVVCDRGALADRIWIRSETTKFPILDPSECEYDDRKAFAVSILAVIDDGDRPYLQSFIARQREQYKHTSQDDGDVRTDPKIKYLAWIRTFYFHHVYEFLIDKFLKSKTLPHRFVDGVFLPFIAPGSRCKEAAQEAVSKATALMLESDLGEVNVELIREWNLIERVTGSKSKQELLVIATAFFEETDFRTINRIIDARKTSSVSLFCCDASEQQRRRLTPRGTA